MKEDITPRNAKGQPHGLWECYYKDKIWYKCIYINGEINGFNKLYCDNDGKLTHKRYCL